jgi:probable HAF family extracellular repeat protein
MSSNFNWGLRAAALCAAITVSSAAGAAPPSYRIEALAKANGVRPEVAQAINRRGDITGYGSMGPSDRVVFVVHNGKLQALEGPQAGYAFGNAINADGAVAGTMSFQAYTWTGDGSPLALDPLVPCDHAGWSSSGQGINDAGDVVLLAECVVGGKPTVRSFRYSAGVMQDLGNLGSDYNEARGINNLGQVTGISVTAPDGNGDSHARAYILDGAGMHDLGTLGGSSSSGYALNDLGHAVGTSTDAAGVSHAFLYSAGTMQALPACEKGETWPTPAAINRHDVIVGTHIHQRHGQGILFRRGRCFPLLSVLDASGAGWDGLNPQGINDNGVIVGWGLLDGKVRAFIATPVVP